MEEKTAEPQKAAPLRICPHTHIHKKRSKPEINVRNVSLILFGWFFLLLFCFFYFLSVTTWASSRRKPTIVGFFQQWSLCAICISSGHHWEPVLSLEWSWRLSNIEVTKDLCSQAFGETGLILKLYAFKRAFILFKFPGLFLFFSMQNK